MALLCSTLLPTLASKNLEAVSLQVYTASMAAPWPYTVTNWWLVQLEVVPAQHVVTDEVRIGPSALVYAHISPHRQPR